MGVEYDESFARMHADIKVTQEHDARVKPWPGHHKNVTYWFELENGYAVAFNENPALGWSFPIMRMR
jgi:hypothetical protein